MVASHRLFMLARPPALHTTTGELAIVLDEADVIWGGDAIVLLIG